jgi:HSP20 family protein
MNAIAMYKPFAIDRALEDFDRYVGSFFGESPLTPALRMPAVDIREDSDAYIIEADLPGYDEKAVEVRLDGRVLTIGSKKTEEKQEDKPGKENFLIRERRQLSFKRSFTLPDDADHESVEAHFKNGVLSLSLKKRPEAKSRTIEISAE